MTRFNISYERNGVCQTLLINAESEELAKAYFMEHKTDATFYGIHEATRSDERPGKPVINVPADYSIETATEDTEAEKEGENTMTNTEKIYNENRNYCKSIAEDIDLYVNGDGYKCPDCGSVHPFEEYEANEHENENGLTAYYCPYCDAEIEESELESISIYDYFDDIFDIEYRIGSNKEYRSVCVMIACGGPNIYIDTATKNVEFYCWSERASYPLSLEAVNEIDNYFEELFNCNY